MNISLRKITALLLALCMIFAIVGCNNTPADNNQTPDQTPDQNQNNTTDNTVKDEFDLGTFTPTGPIKNVIFIIGDGMGKSHIEAGALDRGSDYDFQSWKQVNVNTDSIDKDTGALVMTDSSASATALATGTLTCNSLVGIDPNGKNLATIMDYAKAAGKSTGIVTTDYLYGATPAGFSAHAMDRDDKKAVTETQLSSGIDFLAGLTSNIYGQTLYKNMISASPYYFGNTLSDSEIAQKDKVMLALNIEDDTANSVSLSDTTKAALSYLERDTDGFVLMIEQAYIDKHSHNNKFGDMVSRMHSLGETVAAVMEWVGDRNDTVVLISADHETGGLSVSKTEQLQFSYNGQNGTFYFAWRGKNHTQAFVDLYVYGIDEDFGTYKNFLDENLIKNTDIFLLMKRLVTTGQ